MEEPSTKDGLDNEELFDMDCNWTHPDMLPLFPSLFKDNPKVSSRYQMLVPGASIAESKASITLCKEFPTKLFPTAGVHPYNVNETKCTESSVKVLDDLVANSAVRAVGECGLDYSEGFPPSIDQLDWFRVQLKLAIKHQKPIFLHERLAHNDFIKILNDSLENATFRPKMLVHCFTGTSDELQAYLSLGCMIGITGFVCRKNNSKSLLHQIPLDRLVVETDAPYMGFPNCRKQMTSRQKQQYPNVPTSLPMVINTIATTLNVTPAKLARITTKNARMFLGI